MSIGRGSRWKSHFSILRPDQSEVCQKITSFFDQKSWKNHEKIMKKSWKIMKIKFFFGESYRMVSVRHTSVFKLANVHFKWFLWRSTDGYDSIWVKNYIFYGFYTCLAMSRFDYQRVIFTKNKKKHHIIVASLLGLEFRCGSNFDIHWVISDPVV